MVSWNVLVFGSDLKAPFAVSVTDPSKWTLADLKKEIRTKWLQTSNTVRPYAVADLEVYCGEKKIAEGKPLFELDGMHNGVGVVVTIKPFIINVYCSNDNVSLQVEIPRKEFKQWTVSSLRSVVCLKRGFDVDCCQHDIFAFSGNILADSSLIYSIPGMVNNCLVTYTRVTGFQYPRENGKGYASVPSPLGIGEEFASNNFFHKRNVYEVDLPDQIRTPVVGVTPTCMPDFSWTITIQTLGGSMAKIVMKKPTGMPIFKLRELVMKAMSIPTHKQRLTAGDTVLEDWDEEGRAMLVIHYPKLYDGATVHLVTLTDGIRVELNFESCGIHYNPAVNTISYNLFHKHQEPSYLNISWQFYDESTLCDRDNVNLLQPNYLNIHYPKTLKQKTLMSVMKNCVPRTQRSDYPGIYQVINPPSTILSHEFVPSDDPVSMIKWITDGCTLGLKDYPIKPVDFTFEVEPAPAKRPAQSVNTTKPSSRVTSKRRRNELELLHD